MWFPCFTLSWMGRTGCKAMTSSLTCMCAIGLGWSALMSPWLNWNGAPTISMEYTTLASRRKFRIWHIYASLDFPPHLPPPVTTIPLQTKGSLHIFKEKGSFPTHIYHKSQPTHMTHSTSRLVLYAPLWTLVKIWPPVTRSFIYFFIHYHIWHEASKASYNEPGSTGHSWALKEMIQGDVIRVVDKGQ